MAILYLPVMCPGAGKSTYAEKLVERGVIDRDAVVSPDRYREILTGNRTNQDSNGVVFSVVDRICLERLSNDLDVYLDATNLNPRLRRKFLQKVKENVEWPVGLRIILSDAPRDVVEQRNRDREYPVPQDVFDRFWGLSDGLSISDFETEMDMFHTTFTWLEPSERV